MVYERHYDDNGTLISPAHLYDENGRVFTPQVLSDVMCGSIRTRWYDNGVLQKTQIDDTISFFDNNGKLHNDNGPAVIYGDGTKVYMIHGVFQRREPGDSGSTYYKDLYKSLPVEDKRDKK